MCLLFSLFDATIALDDVEKAVQIVTSLVKARGNSGLEDGDSALLEAMQQCKYLARTKTESPHWHKVRTCTSTFICVAT